VDGRRASHRLDGLGWRFGSSAAAVAVVLTIVALVLPPISTTDISARLFPHGLSFGTGGRGSGVTITGGADTIGFNPSVIPGGQLTSHPQSVMSYTTDTSSPVYVRVDNDTEFANGNWFRRVPTRGPVIPGMSCSTQPVCSRVTSTPPTVVSPKRNR